MDNGTLLMNYAGLTPYLVEALQQMNGVLDITERYGNLYLTKSLHWHGWTAITVDATGKWVSPLHLRAYV